MRVLELFCGIGGCAVALDPANQVVAAVDINDRALAVYAANFRHATFVREIESLGEQEYRRWMADLWWMSPPCQPYTARGKQRDDQDPRARSLIALIEWIDRIRPPFIALENVPPFGQSRVWRRLQLVLDRAGYCVATKVVCPTQLGIPNRRLRFYMLASRERSVHLTEPAGHRRRLLEYLGPPDADDVWVSPQLLARYGHAIHVIQDAADPEAVVSCFTAAYGRSPVRSGSCLYVEGRGVRRFTPREVARLLGFPEWYRFPPHCSRRQIWGMLGNSLSIPVVRWLLSHVPGAVAPAGSPPANNP